MLQEHEVDLHLAGIVCDVGHACPETRCIRLACKCIVGTGKVRLERGIAYDVVELTDALFAGIEVARILKRIVIYDVRK